MTFNCHFCGIFLLLLKLVSLRSGVHPLADLIHPYAQTTRTVKAFIVSYNNVCKIQVLPFMISFADFVIIVNGVSFIVDIMVFSSK